MITAGETSNGGLEVNCEDFGGAEFPSRRYLRYVAWNYDDWILGQFSVH